MNNTMTTEELDKSRAEFEAWAIGPDGGWLKRALERNTKGSEFDYQNDDVEGQWIAWKAAHARASMPADEKSKHLNGIPATMCHDEGAIARCFYCGRYSLDPKTLGDRAPLCACGKEHGWSGSFVKPGPDATWSGKAPGASMPVQAEPSKMIPPPNAAMLRWALRELLGALPERRDWFNPDAEEILRDVLKELATPIAPKAEDARDGARYRFLREHWVSFSAAPPLSNLHFKGNKLDAKIDAAMSAAPAVDTTKEKVNG